ncbi:S-adenosylmethionine mitochondrial carrier protein, partial [Cucurbita argyrosperma subsp. argyrosperma]
MTRVQASTLTFPEIISRIPQIGVQGLYRGSIPAILGQFSSHGLRTGIFEATKLLLINVAPTLPDIQVQSLASFWSTFLGTAVRIPCEVLKQRLQAGLFDNVGQAILGTWNQDGLKGFFRGTGATLCREVPFYVAGMGLYAESKKVYLWSDHVRFLDK